MLSCVGSSCYYLDVVCVCVLVYYHNKSLSIVSTDITVATRMVFKPAYGQMLEFEPSAESFSVYVERVNLLFTANEVPEEKRVPVFLTIVGKSTYALLRNLLQPSLPKDKMFEDNGNTQEALPTCSVSDC